ncbi:MAG: GNAT family N-acyltransferase [Roseobacter sp.]|jgi:putative hemolysin|nr:GNAT family N-acyltransferase [Roseobacter sp.]
MSFETAPMKAGRYAMSVAQTTGDVESAQVLRARCFGLAQPLDTDDLDALCDHILIHDTQCAALVSCFRMLPITGSSIDTSYAARYYDIARLAAFPGQLLEMGRFCVDPLRRDPDILRLAWAAMTAYVDARDVTFLFGCTSFKGTDPTRYTDAFAYLHGTARAPECWAPGLKACEALSLQPAPGHSIEKRRALAQMPPLLRTYLNMGGRVSDHAVIDREMDTLHVFTGVEIAAIPPIRQRLLRALHKA